MKKKLRLWFSDFWPGFSPTDNLYYRLLAKNFEIEIDPTRPDVLIYAPYSSAHKNFRCRKLFVTGEAVVPNYAECNASLSFETNSARNIYFPSWLLQHSIETLTLPDRSALDSSILDQKTQWCLFLVSAPGCTYRNELFHAINKHRFVHAPGKLFNNTPRWEGNAAETAPSFGLGWHDVKRRNIARFKFNIACENTDHPGYITEKIFDALLNNVIPIYWGAPDVKDHINPACFIHARDFPSFDAIIKRLDEIDADPDLYLSYLRAPIFPHGDGLPGHYHPEILAKRIADLVDGVLAEKPIGPTVLNKSFAYARSTAGRTFRRLGLRR